MVEVLARTEYQELYRISDGVLLVINKFTRIEYPEENYFSVWLPDAKYKTYHKGCQKSLLELKEDYYDKFMDIMVPKGTVLYKRCPVKATDNKADWTYQVKTTGTCFGGDFSLVEDMLSTMLRIMRTGEY